VKSVLLNESLSVSGRYQKNHVIRQVYLRLRQLDLLSSSIKIKLVKSLICPNLKCLGINDLKKRSIYSFLPEEPFFQR
jgi:hypothetical protein